MHAQHMKEAEATHLEAVNQRGDKGMGFKQSQTVHHFVLLSDGGSIEVSASDPADAKSRDQIQQHLQHITKAFAAGDFRLPMFIHAQTPPGVATMKRLKSQISYSYEPTAAGGRVTISTKEAKALTAIHAFLRFQIADHQTGDAVAQESTTNGKH
jgi:hypothetical protein